MTGKSGHFHKTIREEIKTDFTRCVSPKEREDLGARLAHLSKNTRLITVCAQQDCEGFWWLVCQTA